MPVMIEGTVLSFNGRRGSGVIMPDDTREQYIFHANASENHAPLSPGSRVTFEPERFSTSGLRANHVQVVSHDSLSPSPHHHSKPDPVYVDMERRKSSVAASPGGFLPGIAEGAEGEGVRFRGVGGK